MLRDWHVRDDRSSTAVMIGVPNLKAVDSTVSLGPGMKGSSWMAQQRQVQKVVMR